MTGRLAAAATAAIAVATLALPGAAGAQLRLNLDLAQVVRGTVSSDPAKALTGNSQLLDTIGGVTCPAVHGVATGLGTVIKGAEALGAIGCVVGALDLQFVTSLKTSGADLERSQVALLNVPTALNVDADPAPDVVGTVKVLSLSKFELRIERALGETATLPLKVEAIVDDPTVSMLPRRHINLGYDARKARAPQTWTATAELPAAAPGTTVIDMTTAVTGGGSEIATLAGLFNGSTADRQSPMGGTIAYAPVPSSAKLGLTLGPRMAVRAGASRPVALDAKAELVDGKRRQDVQVGLSPLPSTLEVAFEEPGADRRKVTYTASAPVQEVDASYVDSEEGEVGTKVVAHARDLPTGMTVEQTSARSGTFTATGGDLGSVEVGFANGEPRLLAEDNPYAHVIEDGALKSFAGRIDGLRKATVDATDGVDVGLELGPDARKKLHGVVKYDGKDIDATVSDLPRHIDFAFTPATGAIDYDAHGETIQKITAKATSTEPFVDRATRIEGEITGLPPVANIKATPGGSGFSLTTDAPIGAAEVLLSSGPDGGLAEGEVGADVLDLPERFVAHARVHGLRTVAVGIGKGADGAIEKIDGKLQLASEPTVVRYDSAGLDLDAGLSAIPDDVTLSFDKPAGSITYDASAPIASIDALVESADALFDRAKVIDATIAGLPKKVTVAFKPAGGAEGATFGTDAKVGMVEAAITDGVTPAPALPAGESKVVLRMLPDQFAIAGRLFELKGGKVELVDYVPNPAKPLETSKRIAAELHLDPLPDGTRQDVGIDIQADDPVDAVAGALDLDALIVDLPNDLKLDLDASKLDYTASSPIPQLVVDARNLPQGKAGEAIAGKPQHVRATVNDVPAHLEIDLQDIEVVPSAPLGRVDFELWDSGDPYAALPEDGRNKLLFDKRDGRMHVQGRLQAGLNHAKLQLPKEPAGPTNSATVVTTGFAANPAPLDVHMDGGTVDDPTDIDVVVNELKTWQQFTLLDWSGLRVNWRTNEAGTDLDLDVSTKDVGTDLHVRDLPTVAQFCVGGDQQCATGIGRRFKVNDKMVTVPTSASIFTEANGLLNVDGWVCLPPANKEGDRQGDVYGSCIDRSATNRVEINELQLQDATIGIYSGETLERNEEGDGPEEDELLKLYVHTNDVGIRVKDLFLRNTLADSRTKIQAGWIEKDGQRIPGGKPLRSGAGGAFELLADLSGIPNAEHRRGQIECETMVVSVWIVLGHFDVLPFPGEAVLGDICI